MSIQFKAIVYLYVFIFVSVISILGLFVFIQAYSSNNTEWVTPIIDKILDIVNIIVGATVGALSTAVAYTFKKAEPVQ